MSRATPRGALVLLVCAFAGAGRESRGEQLETPETSLLAVRPGHRGSRLWRRLKWQATVGAESDSSDPNWEGGSLARGGGDLFLYFRSRLVASGRYVVCIRWKELSGEVHQGCNRWFDRRIHKRRLLSASQVSTARNVTVEFLDVDTGAPARRRIEWRGPGAPTGMLAHATKTWLLTSRRGQSSEPSEANSNNAKPLAPAKDAKTSQPISVATNRLLSFMPSRSGVLRM